ncbi:MAG TPA: HU family DNA-binding protein [Clostridium sp.]|uniref:HU family DNA-binding protein n=1 Tax=Clostridium sp. TaxID=1506 RepID=UPI002F947D2C
MNRQELINAIAEKTGFSKKDTEISLKATLEVIEDAVTEGLKVQIVGFGSFEKKATKGTSGTIQFGDRKGETWTTEDSFKVAYSCGKAFSDKVKA